MSDPVRPHDLLASLLCYPAEGFAAVAAAVPDGIRPACPAAAARLDPFVAFLKDHSTAELEELYTRTFDINPPCSLEVGWHLFGERYDRGDFLVRMRRHLRAHGIPETVELPDHLTQILRVLNRMNREESEAFAITILPALDKMGAAMDDATNPYGAVIEAVRDLVRALHAPLQGAGVPDPARAPQEGGL